MSNCLLYIFQIIFSISIEFVQVYISIVMYIQYTYIQFTKSYVRDTKSNVRDNVTKSYIRYIQLLSYTILNLVCIFAKSNCFLAWITCIYKLCSNIIVNRVHVYLYITIVVIYIGMQGLNPPPPQLYFPNVSFVSVTFQIYMFMLYILVFFPPRFMNLRFIIDQYAVCIILIAVKYFLNAT